MSQRDIAILIIEDDPHIALRTEALVYELGYGIAGVVANAADALSIITKNKPDLLLVDIDIEGPINGIELVERVSHLSLPIVYTTGLEEQDIYDKARNTSPAAYLVKPYNKLTFQSAIEEAIDKASTDKDDVSESTSWLKDCFFIKRNSVLHKVKIEDIIYIKSDGNYCEIVANSKYVVKMSLRQIEQKLPSAIFSRIHQRFILNSRRIDGLDLKNNEVILGQERLPIGPKYRDGIARDINRLS